MNRDVDARAAPPPGPQPNPRHLRPSLKWMALAGSVCLLAAIVMHLLTAAAGVVSMLLRLGTGWTWWRHRPATVKVYRFLRELAAEDTEVVVLCEGDMTFGRATSFRDGHLTDDRRPADRLARGSAWVSAG